MYLSFPSDTRGVFSCRSSLPCLVPNADRMLAAATYPVLGWDGPHPGPSPTYASRCGLDVRPSRSQLVSARKLCSGDALRPDLPWVLKDNNRSIHGSQCALLGPLTVRRTTPLYSEKRPGFDFNQILHSIARVNGCTVGLPGGHNFGQHPVQRGGTMCQCACWWWSTRPKRVCQSRPQLLLS